MRLLPNRRSFLKIAAAAPTAWAAPADFDVAVYGGVPCGIAAAIAAARENAKVLLIEPTRHVGGLNTSGINTAESEHMLRWTIGGIALDFYSRLGKHYGTGQPEFYFESSAAEQVFRDMLDEAGVTVWYGNRLETVECSAARIRSLTLGSGRVVRAKVFVDAGYEGDLMARAGVSNTFGREARSEYGEEAAGVRADLGSFPAITVDSNGNLLPGISAYTRDLEEGSAHRGVMNYNFRLTFARSAARKIPIPPPERYDRRRYELLANWFATLRRQVTLKDLVDLYPRRNGKFEVNNKQTAIISLGHFGGQFNYPDASYAERERIVADHWNYTLGLLHFLARDPVVPANLRTEMRGWGLHRDEFTDNRHLPYQLYVREARRMRGPFVMTQRDVTEDRRKEDAVGISSHFIDSHHVQRIALSPGAFANEGRIWRIGRAYQIPYRALTPRAAECGNLLVPGAVSFSHVAFCTYRLESVWMIGGHAAGVAAAMAAREGTAVQEVPVRTLQRKLRAQKQVVDFAPNQPEKWSDPHGGTGGMAEF